VSETLSVVVPVWNEETTIGTLVEELDEQLPGWVDGVEIIVVDDASTDATPAILASLADQRSRVRVIRSDQNRGHGASVLRGLAEASGEWVFHVDSDGQFIVSEFTELWKRRQQFDLILGRRVHRHDPTHRLVLSRVVAAAVSLLAGRRLRDPNAPFKLFRRTLWEDIRPLISDGSLAPSILIAAGAVARGWRVVEVPVSHRARPAGRSTLRTLRLLGFSARGLGQLLRFRLRLGTAVSREGRAESARERLAYAAVLAVALTLRLVALGDKPLHHDESVHAWFTWLLATGHGYQYDPIFHGPVQFYLDAIGYLVAGVGETGARLLPAIAGSVITLLPYFLRRQLGRIAALSASALLCISPSYLYFSRFAREDIYAALLTLAMLVVAVHFLERPRRWHPAALLALLAASFATKETTFITSFVAGTFLVGTVGYQVRRERAQGRQGRSASILRAVRSVGRDAWIWAAASFAALFTLLFTTFLQRPQGLRTALYDSLSYWVNQQPVNRGGQPWFYYLVVLAAYELPVLVLAAVGIITSVRRPTLLRLYLVWSATLNLVVYSWASERMPWLVLHLLLPLVLLAGVGLQTLWERRRTLRTAAVGFVAAGAAFLLWGAVNVTYVHPADPAELLVFTQTSIQSNAARKAILQADHQALSAAHRHATIQVDSWDGTAWPWSFYLRDLPVQYVDMSGQFTPDADLVVVADSNRSRVLPHLAGYTASRFHLREWWAVDWGGMSVGDAFRWFTRREAWSAKGTLDQWLYVRTDALWLSGRDAAASSSNATATRRCPVQ
jgi:uncharacterized protein (TIGR03663 family)